MGRRSRPKATNATTCPTTQKERFLVDLADGWSVQHAAETAGIHRVTAYRWRDDDPEFAAGWDAALEAGTDALEDSLMRRAKGMSDTAAIFLLKARRPAKYREVTRHEHTGKDGEPIRHTFDLTRLTDEELTELERISRRAANTE